MGTQRTLGHTFERLVANTLQVCFPDSKVARGFQARDATMCDVEGTPFRVECKRRVSKSALSYPTLHKFLARNEEEGRRFSDGRIPLIVTRLVDGTGCSPLVHLYLNDFVALVERHFYKEDEAIPIKGLDDE